MKFFGSYYQIVLPSTNIMKKSQKYCHNGLELLTHNEVKLRATTFCLAISWVETVTPVDTKHTHDWQIEAHTYTSRALDLKWRELLPRVETITTLEETKHVD